MMAKWPNELPLTAHCISPLGPDAMAEWSKVLPLNVRCIILDLRLSGHSHIKAVLKVL